MRKYAFLDGIKYFVTEQNLMHFKCTSNLSERIFGCCSHFALGSKQLENFRIRSRLRLCRACCTTFDDYGHCIWGNIGSKKRTSIQMLQLFRFQIIKSMWLNHAYFEDVILVAFEIAEIVEFLFAPIKCHVKRLNIYIYATIQLSFVPL